MVVGGPLLLAADGEDVDVAEADTDEGGSKEARVVGNDVDEPLWA